MTKNFASLLLLVLTPLVFVTLTAGFFNLNKLAFIFLTVVVMLIVWSLKLVKKNQLNKVRPGFVFSLIIFSLAIILNTIFVSEALPENLVARGALFLILPLGAYLVAEVGATSKTLRQALFGLMGVSSLLGLHSILQLLVISSISTLPAWAQSLSFSPTGSPLAVMSLLAVTIIIGAIWSFKTSDLTLKSLLLTSVGIQVAAVIAYLYLVFQGEIIVQLLPLRAGWSITLDALKSARQLILGIGSANFAALFAQTRPAYLAQTDYWNTIFTSSSTELLNLLTTVGLLGTGGMILIIVQTIKASLRLTANTTSSLIRWTFYLLVASLLFLPATTITFTWLFVIAGLIVGASQEKQAVDLPPYLGQIFAALAVILIAISGFFGYKAYAAEVVVRKAQVALQREDAQGVYDGYVRAIELTPRMASYRMVFSQINLNLANSISQQENLTDEQRTQVTTLVQRAIQQGQVATQLRPSLFSTWQSLGGTYRQLINVAEGADGYAIDYLGRAVSLNSTDPQLRVEFGSLYYQLAQLVAQVENSDPETVQGLLDKAVQQFQLAIQLKPDMANAYYNLAKTFQQRGNYRTAYQAMAQVLANLDPDSSDYQLVQKELLALEAQLPQDKTQVPQQGEAAQTQPTVLQEPAPLPSPLPGGPIEIPTDLEAVEEEVGSDTQPGNPGATDSGQPSDEL